ncbi:MAG: chemotaxis protein CheW [Nitrococcus sp.]|nr:chemotaxis protein CheW [Nitrococcus sp.]
MAMEQAESIRCFLIPISDHNLLLPAAVVAEVAGFQEADPVPDCLAEQEWLFGFANWRNQKIPLISMEAVITGERADPSAHARIVVLKGIGGRLQLPYFAVLTQHVPRPTILFEPAVESLDEFEPIPGIHGQVLVNGEPALLPDLEEIESQLHTILFE